MLVKKTRESLLYSETVAFPSIIIPYLNWHIKYLLTDFDEFLPLKLLLYAEVYFYYSLRDLPAPWKFEKMSNFE